MDDPGWTQWLAPEDFVHVSIGPPECRIVIPHGNVIISPTNVGGGTADEPPKISEIDRVSEGLPGQFPA
jgi:hypothetical protein